MLDCFYRDSGYVNLNARDYHQLHKHRSLNVQLKIEIFFHIYFQQEAGTTT